MFSSLRPHVIGLRGGFLSVTAVQYMAKINGNCPKNPFKNCCSVLPLNGCLVQRVEWNVFLFVLSLPDTNSLLFCVYGIMPHYVWNLKKQAISQQHTVFSLNVLRDALTHYQGRDWPHKGIKQM